MGQIFERTVTDIREIPDSVVDGFIDSKYDFECFGTLLTHQQVLDLFCSIEDCFVSKCVWNGLIEEFDCILEEVYLESHDFVWYEVQHPILCPKSRLLQEAFDELYQFRVMELLRGGGKIERTEEEFALIGCSENGEKKRKTEEDG